MPALKPIALVSPSRRLFLFETTAATLSGVAIALLAGVPRLARAAGPAEGQALTDIQILNAALAPSARRSPPTRSALRAACSSRRR